MKKVEEPKVVAEEPKKEEPVAEEPVEKKVSYGDEPAPAPVIEPLSEAAYFQEMASRDHETEDNPD